MSGRRKDSSDGPIGTSNDPKTCKPIRSLTVRVAVTLAAVALLVSYQPRVNEPVLQAQTPYFTSDEDKFLNSVMVRAYNAGDTESLEELLQYWQDEHTTAL